ncbi:hypothetical protein AB0G60_25385 [Streptomyces angustmyceticus]|uniref:Uncharacterized protein n=1 Tax=Streptomyces angustmyceticus TaxID=285578 RepID=A0A5J4LDJ8_9ACTN|nr:hypothetical protein [Streptomyces angustmyceticus]UAL68805.1 hypothetical protein K7396_21610 [Streptomyces angustmyceticus]GES32273.1 hypothetical protein San01_47600 [Streptomyces angustmyceticus]
MSIRTGGRGCGRSWRGPHDQCPGAAHHFRARYGTLGDGFAVARVAVGLPLAAAFVAALTAVVGMSGRALPGGDACWPLRAAARFRAVSFAVASG